jgi:hypothetical protein
MKKFVVSLFLTSFIAAKVLAQDPAPTLRIVTETPGLPSELFYGTLKVKPLRFRPCSTPPCTTPITIADHDFFIQQQYIDFLRRFPDPGQDGVFGTGDDGLQFYLNILAGCNNDVECVKFTKGALAANFFRSPEFQRKGSYVMYLYMVSIGQRPMTPAELSNTAKVERPGYTEFMADLASISTPNDDPVLTETKKAALADAWMQRAEIQARYGALSNSAFVQALVDTAGINLSNKQALIDDLNASPARKTRAQVLRAIAESPEVDAKFYKPAFVTMQYFGFLRRNPEDCHNQANWGGSDPSQCGYIFHNNRFLLTADQAFLENTMVRGFTESPEYFNRF